MWPFLPGLPQGQEKLKKSQEKWGVVKKSENLKKL